MFLRDGAVGFLDLEQDPLAVMSLPKAQARDALYLFSHVCDLAKAPETPSEALRLWLSKAPAPARAELIAILDKMRPFVAVTKLIARIRLGSDLRRFLAGMTFLLEQAQAMADPFSSWLT